MKDKSEIITTITVRAVIVFPGKGYSLIPFFILPEPPDPLHELLFLQSTKTHSIIFTSSGKQQHNTLVTLGFVR